MPSTLPVFALTVATMIPTALSAADDRLGIRPGMSIAEINKNLETLCDDLYGNPYVVCTRGTTIITVSMSLKDRAFYIARWEVSLLPRERYADQVAQELGFSGLGEPCSDPDDQNMTCWYGDDGTRLTAAEADESTGAPKDRYAIYLMNERIKAEDGAP